MRSLAFPNMLNNSTTNIVSNYDATLQNLKLLFWSEKGELIGDPYYGTNLRKFLFDQNDVVLQDLLIDDFYTAIALFMPQIQIARKDIKIKRSGKGKVTVSIKAINRLDFTTNLYNIVLLDEEV